VSRAQRTSGQGAADRGEYCQAAGARNAKAMRDTVIFVVILSLIIAATLALVFFGMR
jgi:hypothetical protein